MKKFQGYRVDYVADRGVQFFVSARFVVPSDVKANLLSDLLESAMIPEDQRGLGGVPCNDTFDPRKLRFHRANGNTFTIVVGDNDDIIPIAKGVRDFFKDNGLSPVVCIELIGEYFINILEEFVKRKSPVPGKDSRGTFGKQLIYKGFMKYTPDVPYTDSGDGDQSILLPFKMNTAKLGEAPEDYKDAVENCMEVEATIMCPLGDRKHRRYIVTSAVIEQGTTPDPQNPLKGVVRQMLEVPVTHRPDIEFQDPTPAQPDDQQKVYACGKELAEVPATVCLGYRGEYYNKVHKHLED